MKKTIALLAGMALATLSLTASAEDLVAFPGAQGWGRWAKGARVSGSPTVYHVTNLNDSGTGSLRDAVSKPNRIVVFDVSGVIKIQSRIVFSNNLYVAGQTAPGEGITVYGNGVSFSGSSNIICRYLRVRMGHGGDSGKDCAGIANGQNMIFDHCSFSWGLDETFSINAFGSAWNITLQNCIFGQGLMTHSAGGLMQADSITLYRNLYIDNSTRNNKVKGINQYANNVVYNWSNGCYIMGGDSEGYSYVNIESNLFINGPSKGGNCFGGANEKFHCYGNDNWQDSNMDGIFNPYEVTNYSAATREPEPYDYPELDLYPGNQLLELNIPSVGASLPYRDQSDCYMIDELMSLGKKGALISNEESLPIGSPSTWEWWAGSKPQDTDGDGMPDAWEEANGTNKSVNDATQKAANGYLNIENYINSITVADRQFFLRKPITLAATSTSSTITLTWRDYTYDESGFEVEYKTSGESEYHTAGSADATSFTITGLTDGTAYDVRVRAWRGNASTGKEGEVVPDEVVYSAYATGQFKTRPIEVGVVDIDSYEPDVVNSTDVAAGQKLLLQSDETLDINLASAIAPSSVVALGKGVITVSGAAIEGAGTSVNKGDAGTLVLKNSNSYTGATVLHDGVLEFNSIANGGVNSAIGASQEFAQNWIMDGGIYRYTGGNATTNRSARLSNPTTLEVAAGKTLTMTGSIEGMGDAQDFTLDGEGQLTVGSTNFFAYNGTTTIKGGTLYLSTTEIAKTGIGQSSKLVMAGGTLKTKGESSNYETYSFPMEMEEGTYSYFAPNRNCYFKSKLSGSGTLEYVIPYVREYFDANVADFTGKLVANDYGVSGWLCPQGSFNMPTTQVELKGKTIMCMWATNGDGKVGGISGESGTRITGSSKQSDGVTCNWTVGGANSDETFRGTIDNSSCASGHYNKAVNFTKVGSGLWRLTGTNKYQGATTVKEGTLIINGTHSGNCGYASAVAPTYTVENGATLKGFGAIQKGTIIVKTGGTIAAGDTLINGVAFKMNGTTATIQNGGIMEVPVSYYGATVKSNPFRPGTLKLMDGAVLKLDLSECQYTLPEGTSITVFSAFNEITGQFSEILPATPGEGLKWDLSKLYVDGKIVVRDADFNADDFFYQEASWFDEDKLDADGYYWFNADNSATTDQMIADGAIAFDAGGKASSAPDYSNTASSHVGGLKMSGNTSEVVFKASGKFMSAKFDFFRAGTAALAGAVYASEDGEAWSKIGDIAGNPKEETYLDFSAGLTGHEYYYLKLTNSTTAVMYVQGAAITFEKMFSGLEELAPAQTNAEAYDLQGRPVGADSHGLLIIGGKKVRR